MLLSSQKIIQNEKKNDTIQPEDNIIIITQPTLEFCLKAADELFCFISIRFSFFIASFNSPNTLLIQEGSSPGLIYNMEHWNNSKSHSATAHHYRSTRWFEITTTADKIQEERERFQKYKELEQNTEAAGRVQQQKIIPCYSGIDLEKNNWFFLFI